MLVEDLKWGKIIINDDRQATVFLSVSLSRSLLIFICQD